MSEIREEILFTTDDDFWRSWIENREMLARAKGFRTGETLLGRKTLMATPCKVTVAVTVGLGAGPVDITDDLVAFSFEETAQGVGESLRSVCNRWYRPSLSA
jgi:hypothetical protein